MLSFAACSVQFSRVFSKGVMSVLENALVLRAVKLQTARGTCADDIVFQRKFHNFTSEDAREKEDTLLPDYS